MNKLNKTVCLPPDVLAGVEAYREKLAKPTPSFSKTLEQVIRAGLPVVEKKLADVK